jgi:hypothetical protein
VNGERMTPMGENSIAIFLRVQNGFFDLQLLPTKFSCNFIACQ